MEKDGDAEDRVCSATTGTIQAWVPGSSKKAKEEGETESEEDNDDDDDDELALWRVIHDDGDKEDLEEDEAKKAIQAHADWVKAKEASKGVNHTFLGRTVRRKFAGAGAMNAKIVSWVPAVMVVAPLSSTPAGYGVGLPSRPTAPPAAPQGAGGVPASTAAAALAVAAAAGSLAPAGTLAAAAAGVTFKEGDLVTAAFDGGDEWFPGKVGTVHTESKTGRVLYDIEYTDGDTDEKLDRRFVKARENVTDPALWHVVHEDGDEEDLEEDEVEEALLLYEKFLWRASKAEARGKATAAPKPEKAKAAPAKYEVGVEQLTRSEFETVRPRAAYGAPAVLTVSDEKQQQQVREALGMMLVTASHQLCAPNTPRVM
jgi:hypothetical protein